jgi:hypothetical protein
MEENKNNNPEVNPEIKPENLEKVAGGSIARPESRIREAGIDLIKEDGTPGEFGYLWNTGDYYFQGKKLNDEEISVLICYASRHGQPAPSLEFAIEDDKTWKIPFQK